MNAFLSVLDGITYVKLILHYGDNLTKSIDIPRNPDGTPTAVTAADARVLNYTFIEYYKDTQRKSR